MATEHLAAYLDPQVGQRMLDVGCGIGGTGRFLASRFGTRVTGVDLTDEFVSTGNSLNAWVGLDDRISLIQGDALSLPVDDAQFDAAVMLHVGMNIADKASLFREIHRVLRPGGGLAIYDLMANQDQAFDFPVPWADRSEISFVESARTYAAALEAAGFAIDSINDRSEFAKAFLAKLKAALSRSGGPPR
ncbi:MAG: class I SAM-dependent methyltransferase [Burkholderiaceae bacterium]